MLYVVPLHVSFFQGGKNMLKKIATLCIITTLETWVHVIEKILNFVLFKATAKIDQSDANVLRLQYNY